MNPRHITLATIATVFTIIGAVYQGVATVKKYVDDREAAQVKQVLEHERHDEEIDRRLDRLELAVKLAVSNDSSKQQKLIEQVLAVKTQLQQVSQTQDSYVIPKMQRLESAQYPADAPAARPPRYPQ